VVLPLHAAEAPLKTQAPVSQPAFDRLLEGVLSDVLDLSGRSEFLDDRLQARLRLLRRQVLGLGPCPALQITAPRVVRRPESRMCAGPRRRPAFLSLRSRQNAQNERPRPFLSVLTCRWPVGRFFWLMVL
jgi:hypothetical protein